MLIYTIIILFAGIGATTYFIIKMLRSSYSGAKYNLYNYYAENRHLKKFINTYSNRLPKLFTVELNETEDIDENDIFGIEYKISFSDILINYMTEQGVEFDSDSHTVKYHTSKQRKFYEKEIDKRYTLLSDYCYYKYLGDHDSKEIEEIIHLCGILEGQNSYSTVEDNYTLKHSFRNEYDKIIYTCDIEIDNSILLKRFLLKGIDSFLGVKTQRCSVNSRKFSFNNIFEAVLIMRRAKKQIDEFVVKEMPKVMDFIQVTVKKDIKKDMGVGNESSQKLDAIIKDSEKIVNEMDELERPKGYYTFDEIWEKRISNVTKVSKNFEYLNKFRSRNELLRYYKLMIVGTVATMIFMLEVGNLFYNQYVEIDNEINANIEIKRIQDARNASEEEEYEDSNNDNESGQTKPRIKPGNIEVNGRRVGAAEKEETSTEHIVVGSSKEDVYNYLGSPNKSKRYGEYAIWEYDSVDVEFNGDRVKSWTVKEQDSSQENNTGEALGK